MIKDHDIKDEVEVEVVEVTEEVDEERETNIEGLSDDSTIDEVKDSYNSFMKDSKTSSDNISEVVDFDGIQDIEELIKRFNERLEGAVEAQVQTDAQKTTGKALSMLANIPILGKFLEGEAEEAMAKELASQTTREILQEMFNTFSEKADDLEKSYHRAYTLQESLVEKEMVLKEYSRAIRYIIKTTENKLHRVSAIRFGAIVETNLLKTRDKAVNKLQFILTFIEDQLTTISAMMPGIESGLVEDAEIGKFLTSVADMNKAFKSLTNLSNSVGRRSSEKVLGLITEVNESMDNVVDIDHMEKLASTNQTFMKKMITGTEKKLRKDVLVYKKLMDIGSSLDQNAIAYKQSAERVLLETSINVETIKD